jgi:hypothetical protein
MTAASQSLEDNPMPLHSFVRRRLWPLAAAALLAPAEARAQAARLVRIRATVDSADANSINLTTRAGQKITMAIASDTVIVAIVPIKLEDIKPGSFIGSAAMPQPDGTQRALEVHVFPENMRGIGEGHRPFDLRPQSTMTNGTVGTVSGTTSRTLTVTYKDGQKTIVVPPDTPVVTYEPGSRALLIPGAHVIVMGTEASDGQLSASRISVGKDGLVPPM